MIGHEEVAPFAQRYAQLAQKTRRRMITETERPGCTRDLHAALGLNDRNVPDLRRVTAG